eukprot:g19486.t1
MIQSPTSFQEQVRGLYAYLLRLQEDFPKQFQGGYNLLCHSQGALVCRAVLQVMENHPVLHFISLAGPQTRGLQVTSAVAEWVSTA